MRAQDPCKLTNDAKLGGGMDELKGRAAPHRDIGELEEWIDRNLMKSTKDKCKFLHLVWNKSTHKSRLERFWSAES